jgi:lipoprotein-anchoring transpeptidase ErfK/SrfK
LQALAPVVLPARYLLLLAVAVIALAGARTVSAEETAPAAPTRTEAWIARVVYPTVARAEAGGGEALMRLGTRARWNGGPVGLLVLATARDVEDRLWLRVRLPVRPNGTSGWILADMVQLTRTPYRILVSTGQRVVRFLRLGRVVRTFRAVVGMPRYPTPHGLFSIGERVPQPDPRGFLGPWALHLTAFSPTLLDFGGGPGTIGIHGRGGASLQDPLGSARSHGCIRIDNAGIRLIASVAREGTPVLITG